jgi:hypothetical protein
MFGQQSVLAVAILLSNPTPLTDQDIRAYQESEVFKRVLDDALAMEVMRRFAIGQDFVLPKNDPRDKWFREKPARWLWSTHQDFVS